MKTSDMYMGSESKAKDPSRGIKWRDGKRTRPERTTCQRAQIQAMGAAW